MRLDTTEQSKDFTQKEKKIKDRKRKPKKSTLNTMPLIP